MLHTVCFEGAANAEDQSILLAVATPCRHAALFRSAFGPAAALGDPHTSSALRRMSGTSTLETTGDGYLQRIGSAVVCLAR